MGRMASSRLHKKLHNKKPEYWDKAYFGLPEKNQQ